MTSAIGIAEGYIYQTLTGDPTLMGLISDGVWPDVLPREADGIGIVYEYRGGEDSQLFNNIRVAVELLYRVKVVGRTLDIKDLEAAEARMDTLLHKSNGTYQGYRVASMIRLNPYKQVDPIVDAEWRMLGGDYQLYVQDFLA